MKTNNLSKKSLLMTMVLGLSAIFARTKSPIKGDRPKGHSIGGWSPMYVTRRTKFKGYMRNKGTFNKRRFAA